MDLSRIALYVLVAATSLGLLRTLWFAWRRRARPRAWRIVALLVLQLGAAALLYRVLFPPRVAGTVETLVVATAGSPTDLAPRQATAERLIALPEAPVLAGAERVPDLGTALRRHPGTAQLRVVGRGLGARDRDAVGNVRIAFEPAPLPRGLVELAPPERVQAGADFAVRGRIHGVGGGRVELLDPSGQRIDRQPLDAAGRFVLRGATRADGLAEFQLRALDAAGATVETASVPVAIAAPRPIRVLVLAGGPDAELKYLRRWALDSGSRLHTQIQLGGGLQAGDAPVAFTAATLKGFDAVVLDERAWDALGEARRRTLVGAVRDGLGALVRITGPISPAGRRSLAALGVEVAASTAPAEFQLASREDGNEFLAARLGPGTQDAPNSSGTAPTDRLPRLTRQSWQLRTGSAHAWLHDRDGRALAAWSAVGRGRVAAWLPIDTYQLVLIGREDLHAALWSQALGSVARPRAQGVLTPPTDARTGERVALCGLSEAARITAPDGRDTALLRDPATGAAACAGFWPTQAGWHTLHDGDAAAPFHVRSAEALPALDAHERAEATRGLALRAVDVRATPPLHAGERWPWFLAWLLVSALLWWLERSRRGQGGGAPAR